jgi:hypothetical protein
VPRAEVDQEQISGLVDMDPEAFRAAAHRVVDLMADYLAAIELRVDQSRRRCPQRRDPGGGQSDR